MTQHIYEGTPWELADYMKRYPDRKVRLVELSEGEEESGPESSLPVIDDKAKAAIALLDAWIAEGETADEKIRQEADRDVEEFKRCMNANRAASDERLVYP